MNKRLWVMCLILILALGIYLRIFLLKDFPLYQPDNYFFLAQIKATIANNLTFSGPYSSIGKRAPGEYPGLTYITAIPSYFLHLNPLEVMQILPLLFGTLGIIATFLLGKQLLDERAGLLSAFFMATLPAALHITSATEYRGETFVIPLLTLALVVFIDILERKKSRFIFQLIEIILFGLISIFIFDMWSGSPYALVIIALLIIASLFYLFSKSYRRTLLFILIASVIGMILAPYLLPTGYVSNIGQGIIKELQKPTALLIFGDYGFALIFAIIAIPFLLKPKAPEKIYPVLATLILLIVTAFLLSVESRWATLVAPAIAVLAGYGFVKLYELFKVNPMMKRTILILLGGLILIGIFIAVKTQQVARQGTDITPQLLQAMLWIRNNTSTNATFLTLWDDGSLIEGWANRTSYSDSVGAQSIGYHAFPQFLYERAGNYTYLNKIAPNYLLIRTWYLTISSSLKLEANLSINTSINGTNFQAFENKSADFPIVYSSNGIIIYKIVH